VSLIARAIISIKGNIRARRIKAEKTSMIRFAAGYKREERFAEEKTWLLP
jgi:hypothetical protein